MDKWEELKKWLNEEYICEKEDEKWSEGIFYGMMISQHILCKMKELDRIEDGDLEAILSQKEGGNNGL